MAEAQATSPDVPASTSREPKWTTAQRHAMELTGQSVLVSAAAGSGKTSVLAERCVRLVQPGGCNIDELLVVTFTEAAAGEMRSRIGGALTKSLEAQLAAGQALAASVAIHMQQQLARMARAQISTLHGFCSKLIRQHFHLLGIDPQFTVLEPDMAGLLLEETARELFEERYLQDRFRNLITHYGAGFDETVLQAAVHIYHTLRSIVDPAGWRAEALRKIAEASEKPLTESYFGTEFLKQLAFTAAEALATAKHAADVANQISDDPRHAEFAMKLAQRAQRAQTALAAGDLHTARAAFADETLRQPRIDRTAAYRDELLAALEPAKKLLCGSKAKLRALLAFDAAFLQAGMQRTLSAAEELLELVGVLEERFAAAKRESNALDFSDLERLTLALLRGSGTAEPSEVARDCHRRYRHVLVDEYQDINELQSEILRLTSRECLAAQTPRNLFCVGDVKQSIYRFRLADPMLFISRNLEFSGSKGGTAINLSENFRSRGPLLEAINSIFAHLMLSKRTEIIYDDGQKLTPAATYPPASPATNAFAGAPIELHVIAEGAEEEDEPGGSDDASSPGADEAENLDRTEREARYVGKLIRGLMGDQGRPPRQVYDRQRKLYRQIEYGDIVILLRTAKGTANVHVRQLLELGVPAFAESRAGFFEALEVSDMLSLLAVIDNARQDIPLAAVLRSPLAHLTQAEDCLAAIRLYADSRQEHLSFDEAVLAYVKEAPQPWGAELTSLFDNLAKWRQRAKRRPVDELLWSIYQETGYLVFCSAQPRGGQRVANLYELHRRARDFATSPQQGLSRFLQMLEHARQRGRVGEASDARVGADTVQIMSVHSSKGLEFPVVICPDLGRRFNLTDCRGGILLDRNTGLGLEVVDTQRQVRYDSLAGKVMATKLRDAGMAEELRVLYVATTRAREHLILLGSASQKALQGWAKRGCSRELTDEAVLCASSSLQWLYTLGHGAAKQAVQIVPVAMADIPSSEGQRQQHDDPPLLKAIRLRQTAAESQPHTAAAAIVRLSYVYPQQPFSRVAAAQSVTGLSKQESADRPMIAGADAEELPAIWGGTDHAVEAIADLLPPPAFMLDSKEAATAADRGIATHLVLQHLDLQQDPATLEAQIAAMAERKQLTATQAALVDRAGIAWWLSTPQGTLLRQHASKLLRELPFYLAMAPPPAGLAAVGGWVTDPLDNLMVRGRIDALLPLPHGITIIDYKTDRRVPAPSSQRWEGYLRQCAFYRRAVEGHQGGAVAAIHLVFLTARQVVTVEEVACRP